MGNDTASRGAIAAALLSLAVAIAGCYCCDDTTRPGHTGDELYVENRDYALAGDDLTTLDVQAENGCIAIDGVSRAQGTIRARIEVRADERWEAQEFAEEVRIQVERSHGRVRVYAAYPHTPHDVSVAVSYTVDCPRNTDLELSALNGGIEIHGMTGATGATVVNGSIAADLELTRGAGQFSSTNGQVALQCERCDVPLTVNSVNGSVEVALPAGFSGLLDARIVNGAIHCSVPLTETKIHEPNVLIGRMGHGQDTPITLRCVNGPICIR